MYWRNNKHVDQWNTVESTETDPHVYGQLIFEKGVKAIQW